MPIRSSTTSPAAETDTVTGLLRRAYTAELETVANYLAHSAWLDGLSAQEVREALSRDVAEEFGHATKLAQRS
jgi:bacterioferritin (cytochrome b1)